MGNRKVILCLATAVLLIGIVLLCIVYAGQDTAPFSVEISSGERTETINLWESESGDYYVFLPAYVQPQQVSIHLTTSNTVSINDVQLEEGLKCEMFVPDIQHKLVYSVWGRPIQKNLTFVYSKNIAAMHIDTESGRMDYIHEEKGNEESGHMRLYTTDGVVNADMELDSFYGRGNQTWSDSDKKPYGFVLAEEADLLGIGKAQKWVLLANAFDTSHMRNKAVYDFASQVGLAYSPDCEWIDLYLNGEYVGLYLLCERNDVHSERVNLEDAEGYLVSMQIESRLITQNYPYVITEAKQALRIHNPKDPSVEIITDITQIFQSVENALLDENGIDYSTGKSWDELIDLDSWAKMFLIDEIFGNVDASYSSLYFYVDGSNGAPKVYAGPVWDYDHSMGSAHVWHIANPNTMYANRLHVKPEADTPWFYSLYQNEIFYERMVALYKTVFLPALETFADRMDGYAEEISYSAKMNSIRWFSGEKDLNDEVAYIKNFLTAHLSFLSDVWLDQTEYKKVTLAYGDWWFYGYFYVRTGESLAYVPELKDTENATFLGWYYSGSDTPFDITEPIMEDIEIYSRWADKPSKRINQVLNLIPLAVIGTIGTALVVVEFHRGRKRG